jgi:phospholipid/cholesterol/gamma-HCH transport system substrate-binding protein
LGQAADEVSLLIATNRTAISDTLVSFQQSSDQLRGTLDEISLTVGEISPVIDGANLQGIVDNLEVLSANAAEASVNLRDFSTGINDPANALMLQQLLDSARSVFQNVEKITSDLDELTGDPAFRDNLRELIDSLNRLVDASEQLQQQTEVAQVLDSLTTAIEPATSTPSRPRLLESSRLEAEPVPVTAPEIQPEQTDSLDQPLTPRDRQILNRQIQDRQTQDRQVQFRQWVHPSNRLDRSVEQPAAIDRSNSANPANSTNPARISAPHSSFQSTDPSTDSLIPDTDQSTDRSMGGL